MFGQQPAASSATSTPNLFGSTAPSSGGGGGFSFGGAATSSTPGGGFSFGQASTAPKAGGFSFGTVGPAPATAPAPAPAQPSFSFNSSTAPKPAAGGFSFGTPAGAAAGQAPSTGFGMPQASTAPGLALGAGAAAGGLRLGDSTKQPAASTVGGFSMGGTAATSTAPTAASTGGFSLSQTVASTPSVAPQASSAASTSSIGGFNLGGAAGGFKLGGLAPSSAAGGTANPAAAVQPTPAATTTPAAGGLGGGLGGALGGGTKLGGFSLPSSSTQSTASTAPSGLKLGTTTTSAPGGLSLGTATAAMPSLGGGLKLGGLGTTSASSTAGSSAPGLGLLGAKPTTTSAAALPGAGQATTIPMATMSYRELEECINKWTLDLEEQEKNFLQQADQVNAWDRMLVHNGEKITSLHTDLETVKADQQRLEHELDYIVAQQRELEDILVPLEESCKTQEGSLYRQHTDMERERTYQMSENIDSQLKRMVQDLKEIIDHMNTSSTPADQTDPIGQVAKILNAHMNSLQWVDQNTGLLQRKVDEVTRQYEIVKRDQERNVHLAFE